MKVYLGLGSNQSPDFHIRQALDALYQQFGNLRISPVYESAAVGFSGDNFLNLVVEINTSLSVGELLQTLRTIENQNGRNRTAPRFSGRTLDIDILLYGDVVGVVEGVTTPQLLGLVLQVQQPHQLPQGGVLVGGLQIEGDVVRGEEFDQLHGIGSRSEGTIAGAREPVPRR